jgi:hypothetical protein
MPRFVILEHDHPAKHWDLMLERGEVLQTWRLAACPVAGTPVFAEASFDHRRTYLDYEGPISGGRGQVVRWDNGEFVWLADEPNQIAVRLRGEHCRGKAVLLRQPGNLWSFTIEKAVL